MNPTQTHKVFGQGVRGMLAMAIAASAVSTATVKAGPTEISVAAAMTATGLAGTVTDKQVKAVNTTTSFVNAMIASFSISFITDPNVGGQAAKLTASKVFAFYQKGLPQYTPNLAQLAITAALKPVADFKYKDEKAKAKDAGKIAKLSLSIGMKAFPKGTRNSSTWLGFTSQNSDVIEANIANITYQASAAIAGKTASQKDLAISEITKSLVKGSAKFKKFTTGGAYSVVTGFVTQLGGTTQTISADALSVVKYAVKNAKKDSLLIAEAAGFAGYRAYVAATVAVGGTPISAVDWATANRTAIYNNILVYDKKAVSEDVFARVLTGANTTDTEGAADYLSPGGSLLFINNGKQAPVTQVQNS